MTTKELKAFAESNNIDISGVSKKADIKNKILESMKEEETTMENMENQEAIVNEEVVDNKFYLDNGTECSRSAYIRQEFAKDRSRKEIADELGVKYYIVYSATANMYNAAHPENGGAGVAGKGSVLVPEVDKDFKFVNAEGEIVETAEEANKVPRADLMRTLAQEGVSRSAIKDYFEVPYATVYAATKEVFDNGEGTSNRAAKTIVHPVTGETVKRVDYIRELFEGGMDRRSIAKELTKLTGDLVDYATVYAATKPKKEEEVEEVEAPVEAPVEEAPVADVEE